MRALLPEWQAADGGGARDHHPCAVPARALRAGIAIVLLLPYLTGCYHYVPAAGTAIPSGTEVEVDVTDQGRVALAEPVGPGVRQVDGRLLEVTDSSLVLSVDAVHLFDLHLPMRWAGERLEVRREHVSETRERRLSRTRSLVAVAMVVVVAVVVSTIGIFGLGGDDADGRLPPGNGEPQ